MCLKFLIVLFLLLAWQGPCYARKPYLYNKYIRQAKEAALMKKRADVYKFVKTQDDEKWINRFKANFLRNLKMAKPPKPLNITRTKELMSLPEFVIRDALIRVKHMDMYNIIDFSVYVKGEGFNANFGSAPIQTFFFKPTKFITGELIETTYLTFKSEKEECHGSKLRLYEILTEDGNAKDLRDETSLMKHYNMKMDFENDKLRLVGEYVLGDPMMFNVNFTKNWLEWTDHVRSRIVKGDTFYKGFVIKCEDCKCENPIDTEKASLAINYHDGGFLKFARRHATRKGDEFFNDETYMESFAPKIKNDCRKVGVKLCCTKKLIIDVKEIGWSDWIVFPTRFTPNVCYGKCQSIPGPWDFWNENYSVLEVNKVLRNAVRNQYPGDDIQSCCSPTEHAPQVVVFLDEKGNYNTVEFPNFSVVNCGCT